MKKKALAVVMAAAMSFTMLAGCGGNDDSQSGGASDSGNESQSQGGDSQEADNQGGSGETVDVALKVWCPQNQVDTGIMADQQADFAAAHPEWNITWTTEIVGEDQCAENVTKDVDAAADVFFFANDQLKTLVDAGALARLGGDAEQMVQTENSDLVKSTVMIDDAVYGLPFTHNTFFMFYDKTLMSEDDVTSLEKIMAKETADNVYNFYFESAGGWKLGAYYYGAGLSVFGPQGNDLAAGCDWNSEKGLAVTNYLIDLINNPKCAYDGEIDVSELIADHRLGVWFDGAWNYNLYHDALGDDMGMATIPTFNPDGNDYQMLGFYGSKAIGVNAHSQNAAAAVAFATYLASEQQQLVRYERSAQPPTNINITVADDPMVTVISEEAANCSVVQPIDSTFSGRYWNYANTIPTEIRSKELTKDNAQEKLDAFVDAMTAE